MRYGCDRAEVEASFDLPADHPAWEAVAKLGIQADAEELLIIRRELTANGKSMCRINGQMVNLTMLREVGELLINIHGQHEHQSLLKVERHLTGLMHTAAKIWLRSRSGTGKNSAASWHCSMS